MVTRGADWQGAFASPCFDEEVYAAYINALILGRPRRTEPLEITEPGKTDLRIALLPSKSFRPI